MTSWSGNSSPDRAIRVLALAGDIGLYSWAGHLMLGVKLRWTSIPGGGGESLHARYRNRDKLLPDGSLSRIQTLGVEFEERSVVPLPHILYSCYLLLFEEILI